MRDVDEAQRDAVADLHEEIEHMSALVRELLSFSKAGVEPTAKPLVPVNVAEAARRAIDRENRSGREIETAIAADLEVMADADYLFRSLANLIRNALRYAAGAEPISEAATSDHETVTIQVSDCGPGLPPDASRTRESGDAEAD